MIRLIVGLGNPGDQYRRTRHNAGWMALDRLAERIGAKRVARRFEGLLAAKGDVWLLKPLTFMNRSGMSVAVAMAEGSVALPNLLVLSDDLALPLGTIRLRSGGSSGGHRGLESVSQALGTEEFARLRMGIGNCPEGVDARGFVLSEFAEAETLTATDMAERSTMAAMSWLEEGIESAMNRFNKRADQ